MRNELLREASERQQDFHLKKFVKEKEKRRFGTNLRSV